ncbi:MAG: acyl-CoA dehydrogenase [Alphaproteobacteria bacterium]|nr:acyl-CoA dehydrogenase [Alphaproteobacteria bacterium]
MIENGEPGVARREEFRSFVEATIAPHAARFDREEKLDHDVIRKIAGAGYLTPWLPKKWGGEAMDMTVYGLLNEEVGYACAATRSLLTAHGMVAQAIHRCGSTSQRDRYLPLLSNGDRIAAFALSEPAVGSDAAHPELSAVPVTDGFRLQGTKTWITLGQIADLFLVLAQCEGEATAFIVDRRSEGLSVTPIAGMLGARGAMLATLDFDGCVVAADQVLARPGSGFSLVAATALDHGRYGVAWSCVGMIRACLDTATRYTSERSQFGAELSQHQLVRRIIADMLTGQHAADLLCRRAGTLREAGDPNAVMETIIAKYFASKAAMRAAVDAVQLLGANGCSDRYPVARILRDAKVMEIIEGSSEISQLSIAGHAYRQHPVGSGPPPAEST